MRLKIIIDAENNPIPFEYHRFLQAIIYRALNEDTGNFLHEQGYGEDRKFKLFVYSELIGRYKIQEKHLVFTEPVTFYISSVSSKMLNELYLYFNKQEYIFFNHIPLRVIDAEPVEDIVYHEDQRYMLQTLSPIVCYKTDDKNFTTFFHPKSRDFEESLKNNIQRKYEVLFGRKGKDIFEIDDIIKYKRTMVKYKKTSYEAYLVTMKVHVGDAYLKLLMHTGLGSKNSAGFGMMKIKREV